MPLRYWNYFNSLQSVVFTISSQQIMVRANSSYSEVSIALMRRKD